MTTYNPNNMAGQSWGSQMERPQHLLGYDSGNLNVLLAEEVDYMLQQAILKASFARQQIRFRPIRGTDTLVNMQIGRPEVKRLERGIIPDTQATEYGRVATTVETPYIIKNQIALIDDYLTNWDLRQQLASQHGASLGKWMDEAVLNHVITASTMAVNTVELDPVTGAQVGFVQTDGIDPTHNWYDPTRVRQMPRNFRGGTFVQLPSVGDEYNAQMLYDAIIEMCKDIESKDIDLASIPGGLWMRPSFYYTLAQHPLLINSLYAPGNNNLGEYISLKVNGLKIFRTNRFPKAAAVGVQHILSTSLNNNAYNPESYHAHCVGVFWSPESIFAAELIPPKTDVYYDQQAKATFVDTMGMFGLGIGRLEYCAGIFRADYGTTTNALGKKVLTSAGLADLSRMELSRG